MRKSGKFLLLAIVVGCILLSDSMLIAQTTKLSPNDELDLAAFGKSVAIAGNYAVVGADFAQHEGVTCGAAYVYFYNGSSWQQQAKLVPTDGGERDLFGNSVGISGEYIVVGANEHNGVGINSGAAYIFKRENDFWTQQDKLVAADGEAYDAFGISVAISGDNVLIGAYSDGDNGIFSGSAYVFNRSGDAWNEQAKLLPDDGKAEDKFGRSVSIDEDYAVVCALLSDDDGAESGSVYIFKNDNNLWNQQAKLTASDAKTDDRFGRSVSILGNYLVIGAVLADDNGESSGKAYIFMRTEDNWVEQAILLPKDGAAGDFFGYASATNGRFAMVGALFNDEMGSNSGAAYLFRRSGEHWSQIDKLTATDPVEDANLGSGVAISEDQTIAGAPYAKTILTSGAAYLYELPVTVGVEPGLSNGISMFPNPVNTKLIIRDDQQLGVKEIIIYDQLGQVQIVVENLQSGQPGSQVEIDVSGLSEAVYIIKILTRTNSVQKLILIE